MALIRPLKGITPTIGDNCFLAETAALIGDVTMGNDCSIWYGAVLRGDVNPIRLGNRVNIQDCAVLHTLHEKSVVELGDNVSVGHNATVHGARVEHDCLIGMGATLLDNAVVHSGTIIAAGALVLSNQECDPGCVYAGVPAKKVKTLTPEEQHRMITLNAEHYLTYSSWYTEPEE
ncbi:gamma carbonic anhydrase family protein [Millionella massiliensis]|uniref:gamma carbonic anhydrase family protein n=1 Tax=Millionella massiliensis TaxID=1871023 RepID=UPI0008DAD836|nr:gamma carbonic anhydrase family protein [Millionella massiliensis]